MPLFYCKKCLAFLLCLLALMVRKRKYLSDWRRAERIWSCCRWSTYRGLMKVQRRFDLTWFLLGLFATYRKSLERCHHLPFCADLDRNLVLNRAWIESTQRHHSLFGLAQSLVLSLWWSLRLHFCSAKNLLRLQRRLLCFNRIDYVLIAGEAHL